MMAKYKGKDINTKPTDAMKSEARRGLEWRKEFKRGGTEVGVARARDISNGRELSVDTVRRMHSYFARHEVDKKAEGFRPGEKGYPSAGRIAWALWSGDSGRAFAARVVKSADAADERSEVKGSVKKTLSEKAKEHNDKHGDTASKRTSARTLAAVFKRGVGAYKTNPQSVRPSVNSPEQWAYARVNSFLYVLRNGKFRSGKHDTDLLPAGHPMSSKGREGSVNEERIMDDNREFEEIVEEAIDQAESEQEIRKDLPEEVSDETGERHIKSVEETDEEIVITYGKAIEPSEERGVPSEADVSYRAMGIEKGPIDEESRRVRMAISSEEPVERSFGTEVLEHSEEAIDLSFLNSGRAPLLMDHDPERQIGVIESAELDGSARRLRATVRFGRNGLAKEAFDDVTDGIRANISVGYAIKKMEKDTRSSDTYVAKSWRPVEASIVSIPADVTVGVGRSVDTSPEPVIKTDFKENPMSEEINVAAERDQARKDATKNGALIMELASKHNRHDLGVEHLSKGTDISEFRGIMLDEIGSSRALETQEIGLTKQDVKKFSLVRAVHALANPTDRRAQEAAAFEFECSRAAADEYGTAAQGIMIPTDVLRNWNKRDNLNMGGESDLSGEDYRAGDFIDVLRNASSVMQAGARTLNGLSGDVKIPKKTAAASAAWIATEGADSAESQMTVGSISMSPKTLGARTDVTRQLLIQSSLDIENLMRDDLAQAMALAIDLGALQGSGSSGQPTGIKNVSGINTVDFGDSPVLVPSFAKLIDMETAVAEDNANFGNLAYIMNATMYGALKSVEKASNTAQFVVEPDGRINGHRAIVSNQVTAGDAFYGNFNDLLIGFFGGLDIVVDPYTNSNSGTVRVVALQSMDVAVRHAVSFCLGNDDQ
jgi:hypothetical protein